MTYPQDFQKLFLDMDSFFASVEQQVNPQYRNKPLGVAPYTGNTGCIISASKEAKKLGIKTGTLVGEAKKRCPEIIIKESQPALYHIYHKKIVEALNNFSPFVSVLSIDEMTLHLTEDERNQKSATQLGLQIKKAIKEKIGDFLTCSVGIAPNQFLAKVAAESKKPDGLNIVQLKQLALFYKNLDLIDLPGININMERILNYYNIKTPLDFYYATLPKLSSYLGHLGKVWYLRLHGFETDEISTQTKTLGHSCVLAPEYRNKNRAEAVLIKLASKVGYRLRKNQLFCKGVSLSVKSINHQGERLYSKMPATSSTQELIASSLHLWQKIKFIAPPIFIYLTAFNLEKGARQPSLFFQKEKSLDASWAMDEINDKFGPGTIFPATISDTQDAAPDRIPFGRPRYAIRK